MASLCAELYCLIKEYSGSFRKEKERLLYPRAYSIRRIGGDVFDVCGGVTGGRKKLNTVVNIRCIIHAGCKKKKLFQKLSYVNSMCTVVLLYLYVDMMLLEIETKNTIYLQ